MGPRSIQGGAFPWCRASIRRPRGSRRTAALNCGWGVQSHGQSLETTLAQIANEILGIAPARIKVVHGDAALTPYATRTLGRVAW
jgi:CO/xanthine dehydrogenase Mo-binding subunit